MEKIRSGNSAWRKDLEKLKKNKDTSENLLVYHFVEFAEELDKIKENNWDASIGELSQLFHSIQQIYENRSLNQAKRNRELSKIIDSSIKKKP